VGSDASFVGGGGGGSERSGSFDVCSPASVRSPDRRPFTWPPTSPTYPEEQEEKQEQEEQERQEQQEQEHSRRESDPIRPFPVLSPGESVRANLSSAFRERKSSRRRGVTKSPQGPAVVALSPEQVGETLHMSTV
jgi:hypothetical protein